MIHGLLGCPNCLKVALVLILVLGGLGKHDTFTHVDVRSTPARW